MSLTNPYSNSYNHARLFARRTFLDAFVGPDEPPNRNPLRFESSLQFGLKTPLFPRDAAKKIQAKRLILGKGVASEMRFGEKAETRDATCNRKLMPSCRTDRPQAKIRNQRIKQRLQSMGIAEQIRTAAPGFDDPLESIHCLVVTLGACHTQDRTCYFAGWACHILGRILFPARPHRNFQQPGSWHRSESSTVLRLPSSLAP